MGDVLRLSWHWLSQGSK